MLVVFRDTWTDSMNSVEGAQAGTDPCALSTKAVWGSAGQLQPEGTLIKHHVKALDLLHKAAYSSGLPNETFKRIFESEMTTMFMK